MQTVIMALITLMYCLLSLTASWIVLDDYSKEFKNYKGILNYININFFLIKNINIFEKIILFFGLLPLLLLGVIKHIIDLLIIIIFWNPFKKD